MGRFHRHADGTVHAHEAHDHDLDAHDHRDVGDHTGYRTTGTERVAVLDQPGRQRVHGCVTGSR